VAHDLFGKPVPTFPDHALMRVVGGKLRGRALVAPKSKAIRPTADRLRESLFNILVHSFDDPVSGARVLDLFAGTGALGIEALSRGAAFALFVDQGTEARALIRENLAALGLGGSSRIFRRDATKLGEAHPVAPFSLAFLDPPYGQNLADRGRRSSEGAIRRAGRFHRARPAALRRRRIHLPALTPAEQPLDVGKFQFHVSRATVIALPGIWRDFHLAQKRIHLLRLQSAAGAH
jgi:16S rRNA (guanine966-N2)-methyltransferase